MFNTETATAAAKYVSRLAEVLVDCIKNDEPQKAAFVVFMLDEAVSPDKPIGAVLLLSLMPRDELVTMASDLPEVPEVVEAATELKRVLDNWMEG